MSQINIIGRVTADFELQTSAKDVPYVRFTMVENIGYGENARAQYLQVWAWREFATQLIKLKVKKGSQLWVTGSLELETYQKRDSKGKDKRLKVILDSWEFIPNGKPLADHTDTPHVNTSPNDAAQPALPDGAIDGDREPLPG